MWMQHGKTALMFAVRSEGALLAKVKAILAVIAAMRVAPYKRSRIIDEKSRVSAGAVMAGGVSGSSG